tara:strand:- start:465 stop:950 length:486 start_codon:yes stop_codon:yes gene_type:complete
MDYNKSESNNSVSKDDYRVEMLWTSKHDKLLLSWSKQMVINSDKHNNKSKIYKKLYIIFGVLTMIFPIIISGLNENVIFDIDSRIISFIMIWVGILNGITLFFNFSKMTTLHSESSNKYENLCLDIEAELFKKKIHRIQSDVFLNTIRLKYESLKTIAPSI